LEVADENDGLDAPDVEEGWDVLEADDATDGDTADSPDDASDESDFPDSWDVIDIIVPEEQERFLTPGTGESVRLHRFAMPVAYSGDVYGLLLEATDAPENPGPLAAYVLDPDAGMLARAWIDDAAGRTDYNSICWTGTAFVAVLPTPAVGARVLAFSSGGTVMSGPAVLEPDMAYSPASEGFPPVLVCAGTGPLFIDRGRAAGGMDRVYSLAADGTYSGAHADVDLPDVITNMYLATSPCVGTSTEAACASDAGLAFVTAAGGLHLSDPVGPMSPCISVYGCDVAWDGSDLVVAGTPLGGSVRQLRFARFTSTSGLLLPTLVGPASIPDDSYGVRVASSGDTLAILTGSIDAGMSGSSPMLHVLDAAGAWWAPEMAVAACVSPGGPCGFHIYGGGATVFWDGTRYVALWITGLDPAVAIRAFRLAP
jgi:hypothetical protein